MPKSLWACLMAAMRRWIVDALHRRASVAMKAASVSGLAGKAVTRCRAHQTSNKAKSDR